MTPKFIAKLGTISGKEAKERHHAQDKGKPPRIAILLRDIKGKFSRWKAGTKVEARCTGGSSYAIERIKWTGSPVPLNNCLVGVPRSALRLLPKPNCVVRNKGQGTHLEYRHPLSVDPH